MNYYTSSYPSLGEASYSYVPPRNQPTASTQAADHAKKNVIETLTNQWWKSSWTTMTLDASKLKNGTHTPNSYTMNGWIPEYTTTISWQESVYQPVFAEADRLYTELCTQYASTTLTAEQQVGLHLQAIQTAINTKISVGQDAAEQNLAQLTAEKVQTWETELTSQEIAYRDAAVCSMKTSLAAAYLHTYLPECNRKLTSTAQYEWGKDGHTYLQFTYQWQLFAYHPNSPLQTTTWRKPRVGAL